MPRENINAGSNILVAMSDNIAKMGDFRFQSNELMGKKIKNIAQTLQDYQKYSDERDATKWARNLEESKFKIIQDQNERANKLLPYEQKLQEAEAMSKTAYAKSINSQTNAFIDAIKTIKQKSNNQNKIQNTSNISPSNNANNSKNVDPSNLRKIALGISNILF